MDGGLPRARSNARGSKELPDLQFLWDMGLHSDLGRRNLWTNLTIFQPWKYGQLSWNVEYTSEFGDWWNKLAENEQEDMIAIGELLIEHGPSLAFPYSSAVSGSRHGQMREPPLQSCGRPLRISYASDRRRLAILLVGETRPVTRGSTGDTSRSRTSSMTSTWQRSESKGRSNGWTECP